MDFNEIWDSVFFFQISSVKIMQNSFDNQVQKMRDGVNDLRQKKEDPQTQTPTSPSSAVPLYCHLPPPAPTPFDPYSHTANSTAGFAQTGAYPTLASYNRPQVGQVLRKNLVRRRVRKCIVWINQTLPARIEPSTTNTPGQDRIDAPTNNPVQIKRNARVRSKLILLRRQFI